jgi:hypothetical protein
MRGSGGGGPSPGSPTGSPPSPINGRGLGVRCWWRGSARLRCSRCGVAPRKVRGTPAEPAAESPPYRYSGVIHELRGERREVLFPAAACGELREQRGSYLYTHRCATNQPPFPRQRIGREVRASAVCFGPERILWMVTRLSRGLAYKDFAGLKPCVSAATHQRSVR